MADALWRLALLVPLLLLGLVAVLLVLRQQRGRVMPVNGQVAATGGGGLTGRIASWLNSTVAGARADQAPLLMRLEALTPTMRVAVLRFGGQDHLLGVSGEAMLLIARAPAAGCAAPAGAASVAGLAGASLPTALPADAGGAAARAEAGA